MNKIERARKIKKFLEEMNGKGVRKVKIVQKKNVEINRVEMKKSKEINQEKIAKTIKISKTKYKRKCNCGKKI